jgi:hypothetical protein
MYKNLKSGYLYYKKKILCPVIPYSLVQLLEVNALVALAHTQVQQIRL